MTDIYHYDMHIFPRSDKVWIMIFTGGDPAGPFDLRYFTLQDITDAINSYSVSGYACALETDFTDLTEAQQQPADLLFDVDGLTISGVPATRLSSRDDGS